MAEYLSSEKTKFIFVAEDCTAVVPRVVYDVQSNTFVGFTSHLKSGLSAVNAFSTESFAELKDWFHTSSQSHLINLHMVQPIGRGPIPCSSFLLSAYGTDNRFSGQDIIMRWISIVNRCEDEGVNPCKSSDTKKSLLSTFCAIKLSTKSTNKRTFFSNF